MKKISIQLTDEIYNKVKKYQVMLQKDSVGRVTFTDSLNYLLGVPDD